MFSFDGRARPRRRRGGRAARRPIARRREIISCAASRRNLPRPAVKAGRGQHSAAASRPRPWHSPEATASSSTARERRTKRICGACFSKLSSLEPGSAPFGNFTSTSASGNPLRVTALGATKNATPPLPTRSSERRGARTSVRLFHDAFGDGRPPGREAATVGGRA